MLSYGDVDDGGSLFAVEAAALDGVFVVGAVVSGALAYSFWRTEWELVVRAGGIEDGLVGISYGLLSRIVGQLLDSTLLIAILLQETVEFLSC